MTTSGYFKVGGNRTVRSKLDELRGEAVEPTATRVQRIVAKKPIPIDFSRIFFFDEHDPASVLKAWEAAKLLSSPSSISVLRMPSVFGPWSVVRVIGDPPHAAMN